MIKKVFIYQKLIKQKSNVIKIRNINDVMFNTKNYLSLIFRVSKLTSNEATFTIICFIRHVYIIDVLKIKIFISNNILESKQIILNFDKKKMIINSCQNFITKLNVINRNISIKQQMKINDVTKISTRFCVIILFKLRDKFKLSNNKDFMFVL